MKEKILVGTITSVLGLVFVIIGIFGTPGVSADAVTTTEGIEILKVSFFIGLGLMVLSAVLFFSAITSSDE
jgi:vacuolar-type H+-ATPase subunit I/STV1